MNEAVIAARTPRPRRSAVIRPVLIGTTLALAAGVLAAPAAPEPLPRVQPPPPQMWFIDELPVLDQADFPALVPQRLRSAQVQARMAYLPGDTDAATAFNTHVDDLLRAVLPSAYTPQAAKRGAGLAERGCIRGSTLAPAAEVQTSSGAAVLCDVVAAQGSFVGQRLRVISASDAGVTSDVTELIYADLRTGELATAAQLWRDEAPRVLRDELRALLGHPSAHHEALREALGTAVPTAQGVAFTVPAEYVDGSTFFSRYSDPGTVEVAADLAAQALSPFGVRLLAARLAPFDQPATTAGAEWVDCALLPCVALTYDDGPSSLTPALLDALAQHRSAATFYMLGQNADRHRDLVALVAEAGHEIGAHTWSHPRLTRLEDDAVRSQIERSRRLLRRLSGQEVASFRPPYGGWDQRVLKAARLPAILWSVDTRDWSDDDDDMVLREAIDVPVPGDIVLMHDIHPRTVALAPQIIAGLRDRGFTLVTVERLFGGELPRRGVWRHAR